LKGFPGYIALIRPVQWLKNLMLLFPPFLAGAMLKPGMAGKAIEPILAFSLASSCGYVLNDLLDARLDAHHPQKRNRPIPSGRVSRASAVLIGLILLACALTMALRVSSDFAFMLVLYLLVSSAYSLLLKNIALVDLFCISAAFGLRLQAGSVAFNVPISEWLFLSVFFLSLFLSTGKRLCEKSFLGEDAGSHRKTLLAYPDGFLDGTMYLTGATVLVTYTMYTLSRPSLVYTVPLCTFGLLRYIFRVKAGEGGDPTESLLKDVPLFVVGFLWVVMVGWGIYGE
jgi:4-hydroxybenzoate polyprenyltransferase